MLFIQCSTNFSRDYHYQFCGKSEDRGIIKPKDGRRLSYNPINYSHTVKWWGNFKLEIVL